MHAAAAIWKNRGKDRMIEEGLMNRKKHPNRGRIWEFKDDIGFTALDVRELPPNKRSALNYWKHNKMSLGTEKENTTLLCPPFSPSASDYWAKKKKKGCSLPSFFTERENLIYSVFFPLSGLFYLFAFLKIVCLTNILTILIPAIFSVVRMFKKIRLKSFSSTEAEKLI